MLRGNHKKVKIATIIGFVILVPILTVAVLVFMAKAYFKSHQQDNIISSAYENSVTDKNDYTNIEDNMDLVNGARVYIATKPDYLSKYYEGGYPTDGNGVCTDVIWYAFQEAGYNIKNDIDGDIYLNLEKYTEINTPDNNIDFRRVVNLNVFFKRWATNLTTDLSNPQDWQPGDIVVFSKHIAICSDVRNDEGIPYILHHDSKGAREADDMGNYTIIGHYRWNK